jgi:excisionase family DNA binding protein
MDVTSRPGPLRRANTRGPLLDYEGAAPLLNCSPRLVRKLVESRQLDSVKVGRLVRIEPDAIQRYIDANRRPAAR